MANKREYLDWLQVAVQHLHKCGAVWRETVPVHEVLRGPTLWRGEVQVFDPTGHPKAQRHSAWSHPDGPQDRKEKSVAVLQIPPVTGPQEAVRAAVVAETRRKK